MISNIISFLRPENQQVDASRSTPVEIEMVNMPSSQVDSQPQASFAPAQRNQETQMSWWRQVISSIVNFLKKLLHIGQSTHSTQSENVQAECIRDEYGFILEKANFGSTDLKQYQEAVLKYVVEVEEKNPRQQFNKDLIRNKCCINGKAIKSEVNEKLLVFDSCLVEMGVNEKQEEIVKALATQSSLNALVIAHGVNPAGSVEGFKEDISYDINKQDNGNIVVQLTWQRAGTELHRYVLGSDLEGREPPKVYRSEYPEGVLVTYKPKFTITSDTQLTDEGYTGVSMSGDCSISAVSS